MARFRVSQTDQSRQGPEHFGPYVVLERLGMGGMAIVHHAKKQGIEGFERPVALKRLLSHLTEDPSFIKSFIREARLASLLQHVNVVQIYDLGRVGHVYFIAMEYIRGKDLRKILRHCAYATGPLPVGITMALIGQMCDALHYAHTLCDDETEEPLGIVHRDISPANAIVARDGNLKIIDFGIAKAQTAALQSSTGRIKGKFAYMSPEAIMGRQLDGRSDLFSMGIVMHELLTSRPLFAVKNQFETLKRVRGMEIKPPSHWNPACPKELDDIVMTALARDVEQRWQSANAVRSALDAVALQYGLRATNRDIAEYLRWAFEQPASEERWDTNRQLVRPTPVATGSNPYQPLPPAERPSIIQSLVSAADGAEVPDDLDHASIEIVWGKNAMGSEPSNTVQVDEGMIAQSIPLPRHTLPPPGADEMVRPAPMRSFLANPPTSGELEAVGPVTGDHAIASPNQPTIMELVAAMESATESAADIYRNAARQFNAELDGGGPRTPTPEPIVSAPMSPPVGHHVVSLPPVQVVPGPPPPAPPLPRYDDVEPGGDPGPVIVHKESATRGLGIALTIIACVAAAIAGFMLVPGSSGGDGEATPAVIAADDVHRVSGDVPAVTEPVEARVCIDEQGAVTTVEISSGSDDGVSDALRQWRYEPYSPDGTAIPACFDAALSP